jgi:hypothetical protein
MSEWLTAALLLQGDPPPEGLLLAMALWYGLGFLGMLLAWQNYRKRKGGDPSRPQQPREEKKRSKDSR